MTSPKDQLLDFLRRSEATPAAKAMLLKRTLQEFVLEYGWWYEPTGLEPAFPVGEPQQCHKNAADLTLAEEGLVYCEGYALLKSGSQPTLHSWVTNGQGRAIDSTWQPSGIAYAGVPFKPSFVSMTALKNKAIVSLLDDYRNVTHFEANSEIVPMSGCTFKDEGRSESRSSRAKTKRARDVYPRHCSTIRSTHSTFCDCSAGSG
jgi:hypothetical protein